MSDAKTVNISPQRTSGADGLGCAARSMVMDSAVMGKDEERAVKKMEKLKPCPFCGRTAKLNVIENYGPNDYFVSCTSFYCVEQRHCYRSKRSAIEAWNRRANNGVPQTKV